MSVAATAAVSTEITVTVKPMQGDLIQLTVNPLGGMLAVQSALTDFDSDTYKPFQFRLFFLDEEATELTDGAMLGVVVTGEPMTRLKEIQKDVILPGTNASYSMTYKVFTFELSSPFHPVLYVYTFNNGRNWFFPCFKPMKLATGLGFTTYLWDVYHSLTEIQFFSISDAYAVIQILKKFFPNAPSTPTCGNGSDSVYCSCGCIVKQKSMKAHLKTKAKHANGDARGKEFLQKVADYVQFLNCE